MSNTDTLVQQLADMPLMTMAAIRVLSVCMNNNDSGKVTLYQREIASELGLTNATVHRALDRLVQSGCMERCRVVGQGRSYKLTERWQ